LDAIGQSLAESGADIATVRRATETMDYHPFIIAKIDRSRALDRIEGIPEVTEGIDQHYCQ